jgi:uncharacterized protein (DUF1330 family)
MKKGYWIVAYKSISDESANKAHGELALPTVESFGSYEKALAAYESAAYKKALQALGSGAERDFRIVEGA